MTAMDDPILVAEEDEEKAPTIIGSNDRMPKIPFILPQKIAPAACHGRIKETITQLVL